MLRRFKQQSCLSVSKHAIAAIQALAIYFLALPTSHAATVSLVFAGDFIPHAPLVQGAEKCTPSWECVFQSVKPLLSSADLAVINLETPLTDNKKAVVGTFLFNAKTSTATMLGRIGFDILSFANNHTRDQHPQGIVSTRKAIAEAHLLSVGADINSDSAWAPLIVEKNGIRIGFLAFTRDINQFQNGSEPSKPHVPWVPYKKTAPITGAHDDSFLLEQTKALAPKVDCTVVIAHWGDEYQPKVRPEDERLARALILNGARLVIGSHPHVIQKTEKFKNAWVTYSLGNFVSNQHPANPSALTRMGQLFFVNIEKTKTKIELTRVHQEFIYTARLKWPSKIRNTIESQASAKEKPEIEKYFEKTKNRYADLGITQISLAASEEMLPLPLPSGHSE